MHNKKVVMLIQGRMGATRLPGKPLKLIMGRPMLSYQIERVRRATQVDEIVLATTTNPRDLSLVAFAESEKLSYYRGSEEDVLDRFLQATRLHKADVIVRITADCPLSDPHIIDNAILRFFEGGYDYLNNTPNWNFPRGCDVELFSMETFEKVANVATLPEEREHVTPYYYRHSELFNIGHLSHEEDLSHYRLTVDTPEDFALISKILEALYPVNRQFTLDDVIELLRQNPQWTTLNAGIKQKVLGE